MENSVNIEDHTDNIEAIMYQIVNSKCAVFSFISPMRS